MLSNYNILHDEIQVFYIGYYWGADKILDYLHNIAKTLAILNRTHSPQRKLDFFHCTNGCIGLVLP